MKHAMNQKKQTKNGGSMHQDNKISPSNTQFDRKINIFPQKNLKPCYPKIKGRHQATERRTRPCASFLACGKLSSAAFRRPPFYDPLARGTNTAGQHWDPQAGLVDFFRYCDSIRRPQLGRDSLTIGRKDVCNGDCQNRTPDVRLPRGARYYFHEPPCGAS